MISLTKSDFQWARSELVIIYPDLYIDLWFMVIWEWPKNHPNKIPARGAIHQRHRAWRHTKAIHHGPAVHRLLDLPSDIVLDHLEAGVADMAKTHRKGDQSDITYIIYHVKYNMNEINMISIFTIATYIANIKYWYHRKISHELHHSNI